MMGKSLSEFAKESFESDFLDMNEDHMKDLVIALEERLRYQEFRYQMFETYLVGAMGLDRLKHWRQTLVKLKEHSGSWKGYHVGSEDKDAG